VNGGTPYSYMEAVAALAVCGASSASVSGVFIVADSSQPTPATDVISAIQYNGVDFTTS
jgi:hypothetical protein